MILGAVALNFTVNFLLILGAGGICGQIPQLWRGLLAAAMGAVHGALCYVPALAFLGHSLWRLICLPLMGLAAFGGLRAALTVTVLGLGTDGILAQTGLRCILAGLCMGLLLLLLHRQGAVPVELEYGGKCLRLQGLRDTGNQLVDPVTGRSVLVVGADTAQALTGLTAQQLARPLENLGAIPGLRLIPYRAVGSRGFLLALSLPRVRIGSRKGSFLVAFAPMGLEGNVQALIGGWV